MLKPLAFEEAHSLMQSWEIIQYHMKNLHKINS